MRWSQTWDLPKLYAYTYNSSECLYDLLGWSRSWPYPITWSCLEVRYRYRHSYMPFLFRTFTFFLVLLWLQEIINSLAFLFLMQPLPTSRYRCNSKGLLLFPIDLILFLKLYFIYVTLQGCQLFYGACVESLTYVIVPEEMDIFYLVY